MVIAVHGATNLIPKDANGTSDPYCIVSFNRQSRRSKVIYRNLNPTWEEQFSLYALDFKSR
jgi:Ca2+-dependent lipid-binding protein